MAEKLRTRIAETTFDFNGREIAATMSFGVIVPSPGDRNISGVISAVDRRLYEAKRGGRNRVVSSPAS